jgi:hypothetical protein
MSKRPTTAAPTSALANGVLLLRSARALAILHWKSGSRSSPHSIAPLDDALPILSEIFVAAKAEPLDRGRW